MALKGNLTNEKLRENFDNSFQLVNYAIVEARKQLEGGEGFESNPTERILEVIVDRRALEVKNQEDEEDRRAL